MPLQFSANDARQLIEEQVQILKGLHSVVNSYYAAAKETVQHAQQLIKQNVLAESVEGAVVKDLPFYQRGSIYEPLVRSIFMVHAYYPLLVESDNLIAANETAVSQAVDSLKKGGIGISRIFASAKKKETADAAFNALKRQRESAYNQRANAVMQRAAQVQSASEDAVWADFDDNRAAYERTLLQFAPKIMYEGKPIPAFARLIGSSDRLDAEIALIEQNRQQKEDDVRKTVADVMLKEVVHILQGVSVDEVNRKQSGMRVKALHDNGFSTMADVYAASVYQLAAVRGISGDTAWQLKRIAEDFAKETQRTVKLRLTADQKTKESTALVNALFQYRNYMKAVAALPTLDRGALDQKNKCVSLLKNNINGLRWIFSSQYDRNLIDYAYRYLEGLQMDSVTAELKSFSAAGNNVFFSDAGWNDFQENTAEFFTLLEQIVPDVLGNGDSLYGLPEDLAREINDEALFPDGLLCTLRRYQEWGVKYILHQGRVLLGDEMGLGKTVQAIAAMVSLRNTGARHFIVVCPASVVVNWCREIVKHSKLHVTCVHGAAKRSAFAAWRKTGGVAVTTYESLAALAFDDLSFDLLVADEAHYVKNPNAARTKNLKALSEHTERLLFMTGTPLENRVDEMISLVEILRPDLARKLKNYAFISMSEQFREMVAPVYYRRKREDVLSELPDLIQMPVWCNLSAEEQREYENAVCSNARNAAMIRRVSWHMEDPNHSTKAARMMDLVEEAAQDGRKILVFSFYLDTLRKAAWLLGDRCRGIINGSVSPARRQEILDDFEKAPEGSVLVAQIQSGGTGLNIQSASVVIICEPQLKPSTEVQAISRAYRMGQSRNVLVYRLLCPDTIDERIMELLEEKQREFDAFADTSVAAEESIAIDEKTLGSLIQEEIDRINAEKKADKRPSDE